MVDKSVENTCSYGHGDYYGTECPACADGIPTLLPTVDQLDLTWGWEVTATVDDNGHLLLRVTHAGATDSADDIVVAGMPQEDGKRGEPLTLNFTTDWVERKYCG